MLCETRLLFWRQNLLAETLAPCLSLTLTLTLTLPRTLTLNGDSTSPNPCMGQIANPDLTLRRICVRQWQVRDLR